MRRMRRIRLLSICMGLLPDDLYGFVVLWVYLIHVRTRPVSDSGGQETSERAAAYCGTWVDSLL